jgi:hypothetical protein
MLKIKMVISNGNNMSHMRFMSAPTNNLATAQISTTKASTALNSSIISRIHNVKSGCGSCGR